MKISSSAVAMSSTHYESTYVHKESMTMEAAASKDVAGAILSLSKETEGTNLKESMELYEKKQQEEAAKKRQENQAKTLKEMAEKMRTQGTNQFEVTDEYDMKIKMLRQLLALMRGEKIPVEDRFKTNDSKVLDLRSQKFKQMSLAVEGNAVVAVPADRISPLTTGTGTVWQKITATSGYVSEYEGTTFATTGIVKTQDGRSIDFNMELTMSRSFVSQIDTLEVQDYIKTDPLVINLDTDIVTVSDQKFYFDLDSDGKKEKISFAGEGSGFLALDKNGDGKINDGSELFGTKSGDGFRDLAAFDEDGNGWIDENDSIFANLKVWTKDSEGNDHLIDLKKADVGAIYLGNTNTQFSLKNDDYRLNAEIKKTGIYLKESTGAVGTVNHVDLVV